MANQNDANRSNQQGGQPAGKSNEPSPKQAGNAGGNEGRQAGARDRDMETGREGRQGDSDEVKHQDGQPDETDSSKRGTEPRRGGQTGPSAPAKS